MSRNLSCLARSRRLWRILLAMAFAVYAAGGAFAAPVDFLIDSTRSYLGVRQSGFVGTDPGGNFNTPFLTAAPQNAGLINGGGIPNGSLDASIYGHVFAQLSPGSIQFFSTGMQQIATKLTGNWSPSHDGLGNPVPGTAPGSIGARISALAETYNESNLTYMSPLSLDPTLTNPLALPRDGAGNFDTTGIVLAQTSGDVYDISGVLPARHTDLTGTIYPVNLHTTYASGNLNPTSVFVPSLGNIDPVTSLLVLPINYTLWLPVTVSGGTLLGYYATTLEGVIVATPYVPEPASFILGGTGLVALCAIWRRRRRKACG